MRIRDLAFPLIILRLKKKLLSPVSLLVSSLYFLFCLSASSAVDAQTRHVPSEVLVVYNSNSPISTDIARYYMTKRNVHDYVAVKCADSAVNSANETIELADYISSIETPVRAYLSSHKEINFIVLTKGVPIRIDGAPTGSSSNGQSLQPSLDSYLACMDYQNIPGTIKATLTGSGATGFAWENRYYNSTLPFSHAQFGGYLVTRLDGYTEQDAERLVDEAVSAEQSRQQGDILLDVESDFGLGDKTTQPTSTISPTVTTEESWGIWNADILHASDILEASGVAHCTNISNSFANDPNPLLGYYSYGSNDSHFDSAIYESLRFAPGSICDTAVSTSARTFLPTTGGQTLMADLIAHGLTACQGYVGEPILDGISSPTIDLSRYLSGYSVAESFAAATKYVGWEEVCIGDPLACPYSSQLLTYPVLAASFLSASSGLKNEACSEGGSDVGFITNGSYCIYPPQDLDHAHTFLVRVASAGPGGSVELHLDSPNGPLIATCLVPNTGDWQHYVTVTGRIAGATKGRHTVCLLYVGGASDLFNLEWFGLRR